MYVLTDEAVEEACRVFDKNTAPSECWDDRPEALGKVLCRELMRSVLIAAMKKMRVE